MVIEHVNVEFKKNRGNFGINVEVTVCGVFGQRTIIQFEREKLYDITVR